MAWWARLAIWCVPPGALRWKVLDGYRPPPPAGYRWVHASAHLWVVDRADAAGESRSTICEWELCRAPRPRAHTRRTM